MAFIFCLWNYCTFSPKHSLAHKRRKQKQKTENKTKNNLVLIIIYTLHFIFIASLDCFYFDGRPKQGQEEEGMGNGVFFFPIF